jgi:hypothetical protein
LEPTVRRETGGESVLVVQENRESPNQLNGWQLSGQLF